MLCRAGWSATCCSEASWAASCYGPASSGSAPRCYALCCWPGTRRCGRSRPNASHTGVMERCCPSPSRCPRFIGMVHIPPATLSRNGTQLAQKFAVLVQLLGVTAAKFIPSSRVVPEPFPQVGARRYVLHPLIQSGVCLRHPTRPQSVDQDSGAILGGRRLVGSLQSDISCWESCAHQFRSRGVGRAFDARLTRRRPCSVQARVPREDRRDPDGRQPSRASGHLAGR